VQRFKSRNRKHPRRRIVSIQLLDQGSNRTVVNNVEYYIVYFLGRHVKAYIAAAVIATTFAFRRTRVEEQLHVQGGRE